MAPKRSSGGGVGDLMGNMCSGAFSDWTSKVNLAYYIFFIIVFLGISSTLHDFRKRSAAGKKLAGPVCMLALLLTKAYLAISLVDLIRNECGVSSPLESDALSIASSVLYHLSLLGLLFVVLYKLNSLLCEKLGFIVRIRKIVPLATFGVVSAVYLTYIGLISYLYYYSVHSYLYDESANAYEDGREDLINTTQRLSMAARILYLLSVVVSTVLSTKTVFALRRNHSSGGELIGWVYALHAFMLVWTILAVARTAMSNYDIYIGPTVAFTLAYLLTFLQALSFFALLRIAKHVCWKDDSGPTHQDCPPAMHMPEFPPHAR